MIEVPSALVPVVLAFVGVVCLLWLLAGLGLLVACRLDGAPNYRLGQMIQIVLAGPPILALLLVEGLLSPGRSRDLS